jgi:hypothetical protein
MVRASTIASVCTAIVVLLTSTAGAVTIPFTEDFATNNSNWGKSPSAFTGADWSATGGPNGAGDGYISNQFTFAAGDLGQLVFRGQDNFNSSGNAFVGNWIGAVDTLSFWIRQNSSTALRVGVRVAPAGSSFPGANIVDQTPVQPNVWTLIHIPISETPGAGYIYTNEGFPLSASISNLGKIQILVQRETLAVGTVVGIDLDKVSVPEPSSLILAGFGVAAAGAMVVRRRRAAARA